MSDAGYRAVQWNAHKRRYDAFIVAFAIMFIAIYMAIGVARHPPPNDISPPILLMRALGACALTMLHVALCIGPLSRLDGRFLSLLYNRRHLGVTIFLVALMHAIVAIGFYGGFGVESPIFATLTGSIGGGSVPFELLGLTGLLILFVMAATSHDYWLGALGPRTWKSIHMLVYVAYALLIAHGAFGTLRSEGSILGFAILSAGAAVVVGLHLAAGIVQAMRDAATVAPQSRDGWAAVVAPYEIENGCARAIELPDGSRIALYRVGDQWRAVADACPHQGGPLSEGRIVDGCITCPWHGHQFDPDTGRAPPPYADRVRTHDVRVEGGRVMVRIQGSIA